MRMTRIVTTIAALGASVATTGLLAGPALAAPGGVVPRYQMETITIDATLTTTYATTVNDYTATLNPCTGEFSGTGTLVYNGYTYTGIETITGTYSEGKLSFIASYGTVGLGVSDATVTGGTFSTMGFRIYGYGETGASSKPWPMTGTVKTTDITSYANHGAYVKANPGETSANSCIGMPMVAAE